ncbi:MAG: hypothetical protein ACK5X3_12370 [Pseudomonadota bacterium]
MPHLITLQQIRDKHPCADGWAKLLTTLGENHAAPNLSRLVSIGDIARSNGAADALWCLRCISDRRAVVRAVMPAVKRAAVRTTDHRVHDCIAAVEKWLAGDVRVDLIAAAEAAEAAEAADAAWAAARAAANAAAWAAEAAAWAWAAEAAANAAAWAERAAAVEATAEARDTERARQAADLIELFPLHAFATKEAA